jgi:hypothetical protein
MRLARPLALVLALGALVAPGTLAAADAANPPPDRVAQAAAAPVIEVAILLDTSSSMDGLIDQARTRLWAIVNDLAKAKKGGRTPDLRVALYEYGNSGLKQGERWIREVVPLSDDLDAVSAGLFALRTNGGEEYCGAVIRDAVEHLRWTPGDHYRAIFIAGNEPFTQGDVPYESSCKAAVTKGIVINTIHCGPPEQGLQGHWVDGARLGDGESMNIEQNRAEVAIAAPQDARIAELSAKLNETYVWYGGGGEARKAAQAAQDQAAGSVAPAAAPAAVSERAAAKASGAYRNSSWDLVDAEREGKADAAKLAGDQLPPELRDKSPEERKAYVAEKAKQRGELQGEIQKLSVERERFLVDERAKRGGEAGDTFSAAVRALIARQLAAKGYEPAPAPKAEAP